MALTNITTFDVVGGTQTMAFYDPSLVDQITYSAGSITLAAISSFNLSKSDMLLYYQYVNSFNNLLFVNFPSISAHVNTSWPFDTTFEIYTTTVGVNHIYYIQNTVSSTNVYTINYVPTATAASFAARSSPVTITLQEWFMTVYLLAQYSTQVSVN